MTTETAPTCTSRSESEILFGLHRFEEITKKGLSDLIGRNPFVFMVGRTGIGPVTNGLKVLSKQINSIY